MTKNKDNDQDRLDDYNFSRITYYELVRLALEKIEKLGELCEESEHPRAYEVLSNMMKNTADINEKLVELQRRMQIIEQENDYKKIGGSSSTDGPVLISTEELLKQLEDKSSKKESEKDGTTTKADKKVK